MAVSQVPLWPATFEAETVAIPQNPESVAVPQIPPLPNSAKGNHQEEAEAALASRKDRVRQSCFVMGLRLPSKLLVATVLFFSLVCRIGEAAHPGPAVNFDDSDGASWPDEQESEWECPRSGDAGSEAWQVPQIVGPVWSLGPLCRNSRQSGMGT